MRKVACRLTLAAVSLALSLHLTSTRGNAAPFVYSESVFGDLPSVLPAPTVFAFDLGTNVVSGQKPFPDTDSFAFSVPAETELVSISLAFASTDFMLSSGNLNFTLNNSNAPGSGCCFQLEVFAGDSSPASAFLPPIPFPVGAGTYAIEDHHAVNATFSYEWDFTLNPVAGSVPEPATVILVFTGLVGLLAVRRIAHAR